MNPRAFGLASSGPAFVTKEGGGRRRRRPQTAPSNLTTTSDSPQAPVPERDHLVRVRSVRNVFGLKRSPASSPSLSPAISSASNSRVTDEKALTGSDIYHPLSPCCPLGRRRVLHVYRRRRGGPSGSERTTDQASGRYCWTDATALKPRFSIGVPKVVHALKAKIAEECRLAR